MKRELATALVVIGALHGCSNPAGNSNAGLPDGGSTDANIELEDGRIIMCDPVNAETICEEIGAECGAPIVNDDPECPVPDVDCGSCAAPEVCGAETPNTCGLSASWFGLGGSEFAPFTETARWPSNEGGGIATMVRRPRVVLGPNNEAWVCYTRRFGAAALQHFDGTEWREVNDPNYDAGISEINGQPMLLTDPEGRLIVTQGYENDVLVRRFDGETWETLAGPGELSGGDGVGPIDVALDSGGGIWVAWGFRPDADTPREVRVKQYDGAQWSELAGSASSPGVRSDISGTLHLVIARGDRPNVLTTSGGVTQLVAWDGATWATHSTIADVQRVYDFQIDANRRPVLVGRDVADLLGVWAYDTSWQPLMDGIEEQGIHNTLGLATDGQQLYLFNDNGRETIVRRLDTDTWTAVESPIPEATDPTDMIHGEFHLAVNDSRLVAAWNSQLDYHYALRVAQHEGTAWSAMGPSNVGTNALSGSDEPATDIRMAGDADQVVAAWIEDGVVLIKRYTDEWEELGSGSAADAGLIGPASRAFVTLQAGIPVVAHESGNRPFVKRFDGTAWQEVGEANGGLLVSGTLAGVFAPDADTLWVVTSQISNPYNVQLHGYSEASGMWEQLGERGGGTVARNVVATMDPNGRLHIAWRDGMSGTGLWHTVYDGTEWDDTNTRFDADPEPVGLAADADGNVLIVARIDGEVLTFYVPSSDAGCGFVAEAEDYFTIRGGTTAAIDPHGYPVAAWPDTSGGDKNIYLKRLEPTGWQGIYGSDGGGGVSNSISPSWNPTIVAAGDRLCVGWQELAGAETDVALRCSYPVAADPNAPIEQCPEPPPPHPLVGAYSGTPVSCQTRAPSSAQSQVRMTFTFTDDRMSVSGSFPSGMMTCTTSGSGALSGVTDTSFTLSGYSTSSTSCSWGLFLASPTYSFTYEFTDADMNGLFLEPNSGECYRLSRN